MNFLSIEQLKELNTRLKEDNTLYLVEEIHYNKNGYNLRRDIYNDTVVETTNSFEEAYSMYKECCRLVDLNAKYYEVFISKAYTQDGESIQYYQLEDYTFRDCLPSRDKMEADYLEVNEYYTINLYKGDYNLFDNMNVNHEHHETLASARDEALQLFKHFYRYGCEWWGVRLDIDFVREEWDQHGNLIKPTYKTVESHYKGYYFNTLLNPKNRGLFVCIRENGDLIGEVETINEGIDLIKEFNNIDIEDGTFTPDYYALCNCELMELDF